MKVKCNEILSLILRENSKHYYYCYCYYHYYCYYYYYYYLSTSFHQMKHLILVLGDVKNIYFMCLKMPPKLIKKKNFSGRGRLCSYTPPPPSCMGSLRSSPPLTKFLATPLRRNHKKFHQLLVLCNCHKALTRYQRMLN